jgi:hypothetical protein
MNKGRHVTPCMTMQRCHPPFREAAVGFLEHDPCRATTINDRNTKSATSARRSAMRWRAAVLDPLLLVLRCPAAGKSVERSLGAVAEGQQFGHSSSWTCDLPTPAMC